MRGQINSFNPTCAAVAFLGISLFSMSQSALALPRVGTDLEISPSSLVSYSSSSGPIHAVQGIWPTSNSIDSYVDYGVMLSSNLRYSTGSNYVKSYFRDTITVNTPSPTSGKIVIGAGLILNRYVAAYASPFDSLTDSGDFLNYTRNASVSGLSGISWNSILNSGLQDMVYSFSQKFVCVLGNCGHINNADVKFVYSIGPDQSLPGTYIPFSVSLDFVSGQPIDIEFYSKCTVTLSPNAEAGCGPSFGFTGVSGILDANDSQIAGANISALSGGDFYHGYSGGGAGAVPEPSTWTMLAAGFALVGGIWRRTTRQVRVV